MTTWRRIGLVLLVLLSSLILLFISIWKNVEDQAMKKVFITGVVVEVNDLQALDRFNDLLPPPLSVLPHEPWYIFSAAFDRMQLWVEHDEEKRFFRLMELSLKRMKAVQELYKLGKGEVALITAVKGVYYWESAYRLLTHHDDLREGHEQLWGNLNEKGLLYRDMLVSMKNGMNSFADPGISTLISTIDLSLERM